MFRLPDGTPILFRPIRPDDKDELREGLRKLSAETIQKRFLAAKPKFSSTELRYLTEIDYFNHIAIAAVDLDTGHIVAVARAVRMPDEPDLAEWAIVVADHLHGQGLGTRLVQRLVDEARAVGIRRFKATMLGDNVAVQRLLAHIHARFERDQISHGVREVVLSLAA